jgi:hypothetical protein
MVLPIGPLLSRPIAGATTNPQAAFLLTFICWSFGALFIGLGTKLLDKNWEVIGIGIALLAFPLLAGAIFLAVVLGKEKWSEYRNKRRAEARNKRAAEAELRHNLEQSNVPPEETCSGESYTRNEHDEGLLKSTPQQERQPVVAGGPMLFHGTGEPYTPIYPHAELAGAHNAVRSAELRGTGEPLYPKIPDAQQMTPNGPSLYPGLQQHGEAQNGPTGQLDHMQLVFGQGLAKTHMQQRQH